MKIKRALTAGLLVGTLDGLAAILLHYLQGGNQPQLIFKFIASGVFDTSAFSRGNDMIVAGVLFHYIIATGWSFLFFFIYPRISDKWRSVYVSGVVYGLFVWFMMNKVIVPLSNTPKFDQSVTQNLIGVTIIILAVGLPISIIAHRSK